MYTIQMYKHLLRKKKKKKKWTKISIMSKNWFEMIPGDSKTGGIGKFFHQSLAWEMKTH